MCQPPPSYKFKRFCVSLGSSVVEKVVDSQYRYDTDTDLDNTNLGIYNPMQSTVDGHLRIKLLDTDWQKFPADANKAYQCWPMVSRFNR